MTPEEQARLEKEAQAAAQARFRFLETDNTSPIAQPQQSDEDILGILQNQRNQEEFAPITNFLDSAKDAAVGVITAPYDLTTGLMNRSRELAQSDDTLGTFLDFAGKDASMIGRTAAGAAGAMLNPLSPIKGGLAGFEAAKGLEEAGKQASDYVMNTDTFTNPTLASAGNDFARDLGGTAVGAGLNKVISKTPQTPEQLKNSAAFLREKALGITTPKVEITHGGANPLSQQAQAFKILADEGVFEGVGTKLLDVVKSPTKEQATLLADRVGKGLKQYGDELNQAIFDADDLSPNGVSIDRDIIRREVLEGLKKDNMIAKDLDTAQANRIIDSSMNNLLGGDDFQTTTTGGGLSFDPLTLKVDKTPVQQMTKKVPVRRSLSELQAQKVASGKQGYSDGDMLSPAVDSLINQSLNKTILKELGQIDPQLAERYATANKNYSAFVEAAPIFEKFAGRAETKTIPSPRIDPAAGSAAYGLTGSGTLAAGASTISGLRKWLGGLPMKEFYDANKLESRILPPNASLLQQGRNAINNNTGSTLSNLTRPIVTNTLQETENDPNAQIPWITDKENALMKAIGTPEVQAQEIPQDMQDPSQAIAGLQGMLPQTPTYETGLPRNSEAWNDDTISAFMMKTANLPQGAVVAELVPNLLSAMQNGDVSKKQKLIYDMSRLAPTVFEAGQGVDNRIFDAIEQKEYMDRIKSAQKKNPLMIDSSLLTRQHESFADRNDGRIVDTQLMDKLQKQIMTPSQQPNQPSDMEMRRNMLSSILPRKVTNPLY